MMQLTLFKVFSKLFKNKIIDAESLIGTIDCIEDD